MKPRAESSLPPERERGNDAARRIATVGEHLRQKSIGFRHHEPDIVAHTGFKRQPAGQQRHVRRQGLWSVGIGMLEDEPSAASASIAGVGTFG